MLSFKRLVLAIIVAHLILAAVGVVIAGVYYGADSVFGGSSNTPTQGVFTVTTAP